MVVSDEFASKKVEEFFQLLSATTGDDDNAWGRGRVHRNRNTPGATAQTTTKARRTRWKMIPKKITLRAMRNYEIFHNLPRGTVNRGAVSISSAGVYGWANCKFAKKLEKDKKKKDDVSVIAERLYKSCSIQDNADAGTDRVPQAPTADVTSYSTNLDRDAAMPVFQWVEVAGDASSENSTNYDDWSFISSSELTND